MKAATVKISSRTHQQLKAMAEEDGLTLSDELERVVEAQRRRRFLEGLADDYARIHEDEGAWRAGRQEQASLDSTLGDGLEGDAYDFGGFEPEGLEGDQEGRGRE